MKLSGKIVAILSVAFAVMSCSSKNSMPKNYSEKTGWDYNDPDNGFFEVRSQYFAKLPPGTVYIPVMTTVKGQNADPVSTDNNNNKRRVSDSGFFMDEFEVTNINWREYVAWLSGVWSHEPKKVLMAMPDETVWRNAMAYNEPYVENYFSHVAYGYYPVVGVTWKQAVAYCDWRTDRVNERELINQKLIPFRDLKTIHEMVRDYPDSINAYIFTTTKAGDFIRALYGDSTRVDLDGVLYDARYRLPTEAEWEYAAYGVVDNKGNVAEGQMYPWKGEQLRSFDKTKTTGQFYANFTRGRGDLIGIDVNNTLTVPVNFFQPNEYGLYNMAGNVNEWVLDVYRATTNDYIEEYNPFRGNVYESDSAYAEKVLDKLPLMDAEVRAEMRKALIEEKKFTSGGGDYRNFRDGDMISALGDSVLRADNATPIEVANMISDKDRVYKGGSWKDRAMWLNPSQRRYLNEGRCTNDIGFRCAMSSVGGKKK